MTTIYKVVPVPDETKDIVQFIITFLKHQIKEYHVTFLSDPDLPPNSKRSPFDLEEVLFAKGTELIHIDQYRDQVQQHFIDTFPWLHLHKVIDSIRDYQIYMGSTLQSLDINLDPDLPAVAGICYHNPTHTFKLYINPFMWHLLSLQEAIFVFMHELNHIYMGHLFLPINPKTHSTNNQLQDLVCNQHINHPKAAMPWWCFHHDFYRFPPNLSWEDYRPYAESLEKEQKILYTQDPDYYQAHPHKDQKGRRWWYHPEEEGDVSNTSEGNDSDLKAWPKKHRPDLSATGEPTRDQLEAFERMIQKASLQAGIGPNDAGFPEPLKDLLKAIQDQDINLVYKAILQKAIRKSCSQADRVKTWSRPSRRCGYDAAGTTYDELPKLALYIDTSGSITQPELESMLVVLQGFLKAGERSCTLNLWHDCIYYSKPYRFGEPIPGTQGGGTQLYPVLAHIARHKPDLSIIITDGGYHNVHYEEMTRLFPQTIFIITPEGDLDHPLARLGKSIRMPK